MLKVGLTGGIGSGKSTVARLFEVLNVPVYYADAAARDLVNSNVQVRDAIIREFGPDSYNGTILNRPFMAAVVFADDEKLKRLNAITHPATITAAAQWMQEQQTPYAVKEAALLFESESASLLDTMIGVSSPLELRIARTIQRDGISREQVLQRIARQMNEEEKMSRCDFVILNDGQHPLIPQVLALHEQLIKKAHP